MNVQCTVVKCFEPRHPKSSTQRPNPETNIARKSKALSRERIVHAAIKLADARGIEAVSMRQLANKLGFGVMSLYNHIKDKDDLLDGMVDAVATEIELPAGGDEWQAALRGCAISAYKTMLKHRWLAGQWGRQPGAAKNRYHESILRVMREANFPEELACQGFHALTMHVVGFALQVLEMPFTNKREFTAMGKKSLEALPEQDFPYLREHIHFHLDGRDQRNDFKYMLDLILDGLNRDYTHHETSAA